MEETTLDETPCIIIIYVEINYKLLHSEERIFLILYMLFSFFSYYTSRFFYKLALSLC